MVSRAFSSMPGLASGIALQIRNGEIKKYLIQPVDLIGFLLLMRIAHKLVYYGVATVPFALVFYLCRGYFPGWPPATVMFAFITSLIFAFLLGFFLEATIGMIGFWFLEVSSLLFVYMLFNFFFSGHMFPLNMLPAPWDTVFQMIPLQYLAFFPAAVFLQKISGRGFMVRVGDAGRVGVVFYRCLPRDVSLAAFDAIVDLEDEKFRCEMFRRRCQSSKFATSLEHPILNPHPAIHIVIDDSTSVLPSRLPHLRP